MGRICLHTVADSASMLLEPAVLKGMSCRLKITLRMRNKKRWIEFSCTVHQSTDLIVIFCTICHLVCTRGTQWPFMPRGSETPLRPSEIPVDISFNDKSGRWVRVLVSSQVTVLNTHAPLASQIPSNRMSLDWNLNVVALLHCIFQRDGIQMFVAEGVRGSRRPLRHECLYTLVPMPSHNVWKMSTELTTVILWSSNIVAKFTGVVLFIQAVHRTNVSKVVVVLLKKILWN